MSLTRIAANVMIAGGMALGAVVGASPVASAQPAAPFPEKPGHGNNEFCPPWCDNNGNGNGPQGNRGHGDDKWDRGPWWANNRHDWWDDRNGPPPWGWGPPPPLQWNGPLPPTVNYWGYNLPPVWNDGSRQWGVWLFGQWIPIIGVGFN